MLDEGRIVQNEKMKLELIRTKTVG
jgi:hypothetical protein